MSPAAYRTGYVTLIGRPNAGKSTLLNRILGRKVSIVSDKPQTTRISILGIHTTARGQIVFIDNPGIHKPLHKLNKRMMDFVYASLETADLVCLIVDATQKPGGGDAFVVELLKRVTKPLFLLINKVDLAPKDRLLPMIDRARQTLPFKEIVPISALQGTNVDALIGLLYDNLPAAEKIYSDEEISDQSERFLLAEIVREKVLAHVEAELPWVTAVYLDSIEKRKEGGGDEEAGPAEEGPAERRVTEKAEEEEPGTETSEDAGSSGSPAAGNEEPEAPEEDFDEPGLEDAAADRAEEGAEKAVVFPLPEGAPKPPRLTREERRAQPVYYIQASIIVEKDNHRKIVIGHRGQNIKIIGIEARREMENILGARVYLDLQVKVRPGWRDSAAVLDLIEGQKTPRLKSS